MLFGEWNLDKAIAVRYDEGILLKQGLSSDELLEILDKESKCGFNSLT